MLAVALLGGGTAVAAKKYVISSKKQIAPKVRKQLKGKRGPTGPPGPQGQQGAPGPSGAAVLPDAIHRRGGLDLTIGAPPLELEPITLPEGAWLITAHLRLSANGGTGTALVTCGVAETDGTFRGSPVAVEVSETVPSHVAATSIALVAADDLTRDFGVRCYSEGGGSTLTVRAFTQTVATQVGDIDFPPIEN